MYEFDFWYAYFDSIFLKQKIYLHQSFLSTIIFQELFKTNFPQCKKLSSISKCFNEFQKFLLLEDTWIQSQCHHQYLKQIQLNINQIILVLNIEKKYGREYWHSKRRIQASICHFFSLFHNFIQLLIPTNFENIASTQSQNKLCTSIKKLQNLVNQILPQMNKIIQFLHEQCFSQQRKLTITFLRHIRQVMLNLPKISKKNIKNKFQLTKYLHLIVPIQISKNQYKFKAKRKKTVTNQPEIQAKYHSQEQIKSNSFKSIQKRPSLVQFKNNQNKIKDDFRILNRQKTLKNNLINQSIQTNNNLNNQQNKFLNFFHFTQKVRKYSIQINSKKVTKATFNTRQTIQFTQKQRKISQYAKSSNSVSKQKKLDRSLSISKHRGFHGFNIEGQITTRSKKSSFQMIHKKIQIENSQKQRYPFRKDHKIEKKKRDHIFHNIHHNKFNSANKSYYPSKKVELYQGKCKGWGLIQQQLNKKILARKIRQLIMSSRQQQDE